jgi:hypothetical protein
VRDFLDIAVGCANRGWYVFPCWPETKKPMTPHGWHDASSDEKKIQEWWRKTPNANVAIACNPSGLVVVDIDHGLPAEDAGILLALTRAGLPSTYTVRTGRRPEVGLQLYFTGGVPDVGLFDLNGLKGQVKSLGGYVMAAGSMHPDSGEAYIVKNDTAIAPVPDVVRSLRSQTKQVSTEPGKKIPEGAGRHDALMRVACGMRARGLDGDTIYEAMVPINPAMCEVPISDEDLRAMCHGIERRYPVAEPDPQVIIGKVVEVPEPPKDWRTRYLTFERVRDAKPTEFLIDGFLALDSITALAAPVSQRKSLIALNVAHALCSGEPLFDYFEVIKKPERVIYLCPEMGLSSFSTRLKSIGLLEYVGRSLFCQTMDDTSIRLGELNDELTGAVVIIDTLTRFVEGDQNSSEDMSKFAEEIFRLKRRGATILLLHHSVKGAGNGITLDSAMRGSSELAAFVTSCWATKLKDPDAPYKSPSILVNVKQRDFESKPFEAISDSKCRMHIVGTPGELAEIKSKSDTEAEKVLAALLEQSPTLGINKLQGALREAGHKKGGKWVTRAKNKILKTGVTLST